MRCQLGAGIVYFVRARAFAFRNAYSSVTMSRSTSSRRVTNGSSGGRPDVSAGVPEPVFHRSRQPDSASRNSNPLTGGRNSGSSMIGMNAIHPFRRYSPSVIASMPAPSWRAIASSTARSSAARSSSASIVPARAASLASCRCSGRSRLPTTSARTTVVAVLVAISTSLLEMLGCRESSL